MSSSKKQKQFDKNTVMGFAINFCAFFSLALMAGLLVAIDVFGGAKTGTASMANALSSARTESSGECVPLAPAVLFPVSAAEPVETSISLLVDDGGFSANQIDLANSSLRTVKISNRGTKPHSFAVGALGVDSGPIEPGQSVTVALENLPENVQSLEFRSNVAGDDGASFRGLATVFLPAVQ